MLVATFCVVNVYLKSPQKALELHYCQYLMEMLMEHPQTTIQYKICRKRN